MTTPLDTDHVRLDTRRLGTPGLQRCLESAVRQRVRVLESVIVAHIPLTVVASCCDLQSWVENHVRLVRTPEEREYLEELVTDFQPDSVTFEFVPTGPGVPRTTRTDRVDSGANQADKLSSDRPEATRSEYGDRADSSDYLDYPDQHWPVEHVGGDPFDTEGPPPDPIELHPDYGDLLDHVHRLADMSKRELVDALWDPSGDGDTKAYLRAHSRGELVMLLLDLEYGGTFQ